MEPEERASPPAPPSPEILMAPTPIVSPSLGGPPMLEFLQRRLEAVEKDLLVERERARAAQNLLERQNALRDEVERHLKTMTEQLRREKAERESDEAKSHARGRIDALEKRLDEVHQSLVTFLKEAVAQRESGSQAVSTAQSALSQVHSELAKDQALLAREQAALRQDLRGEVSSLSSKVQQLLEQLGQWRAEAKGVGELAPELRALARQVPEDGRRVEGQLSQLLADFSAELRERFSQWERRQDADAERQHQRLETLTSEKAALQRAWEEQNHDLRAEFLKERAHREAELSGRMEELQTRLLGALKAAQEEDGRQAAPLHEDLRRLIERASAKAPAKEQIIQSLEQERDDLLKSLRERGESLRSYSEERREVERSMGESLAKLHSELDDEREKSRTLSVKASELEAQMGAWKDKLESAQRLAADEAQRREAAAAERDEAVKAMLAEAERVRSQLEERGRVESEWARRVEELQGKLNEATEARARDSSAVADLRGQIATLAEQLSRAVQERDRIVHQFSDWDAERQKLIKTIRDKDEMISMLNGTFQSLLKKP